MTDVDLDREGALTAAEPPRLLLVCPDPGKGDPFLPFVATVNATAAADRTVFGVVGVALVSLAVFVLPLGAALALGFVAALGLGGAYTMVYE